MYKVEINFSGQLHVILFRGPGCRKTMLDCWYDYLDRAEAGEDIRSIRVWGTAGNKTDIVLKWPPVSKVTRCNATGMTSSNEALASKRGIAGVSARVS